jgi:hypothetical protein
MVAAQLEIARVIQNNCQLANNPFFDHARLSSPVILLLLNIQEHAKSFDALYSSLYNSISN